MDTSTIMTAGDFVRFLRDLSNTRAATYQGSLEEYLRSVLAVLMQHAEDAPTWQVLGDILSGAFTTALPPFDTRWLEVTEPPSLDGDFTNIKDPFEHLRHMLMYQIADLRRMAETGDIDNPYRYFGVQSPTGSDWYNFDPEGFLACASNGMADHRAEESTETECSWTDLTFVLWLGQHYE